MNNYGIELQQKAKEKILSMAMAGRRFVPYGLLKSWTEDPIECELAIQFAVEHGLPVSIDGVLYTGDRKVF